LNPDFVKNLKNVETSGIKEDEENDTPETERRRKRDAVVQQPINLS
jgi:hypothetical protein